MGYLALPVGCMLVLAYIAIIYYDDARDFRLQRELQEFDYLLLLGAINILADIGKSYGVNHLDSFPTAFTTIAYALFYLSTDIIVFYLCYVILTLTDSRPTKLYKRIGTYGPFILSIIAIVLTTGGLEFVEGSFTNYALGYPATICFAMGGLYTVISAIVLFVRWNHTERHKRTGIITYILVTIAVAAIHLINPELFITSIATVIFVLGVYMTMENPSLKRVEQFHSDTVVGFASLIESRDNSTGGHIKRTGVYVEMIANELLARGANSTTLTKDFAKNVINAAPMHDIGKISIPDAILQKPGPLTSDEYAVIRQHAVIGSNIIDEAFFTLGSPEYRKIAYNVARYHHEKWNGQGYPEGLKGEEIPLGARIMAVADVFDALSGERCYRDALSLDQCFAAIEAGRGVDFDPMVVDAFLRIRPEVELMCKKLNAPKN